VKRSPLLRKTQLRAKAPLKRGKPLVSRARLETRSALRRTRFKQKPPRQRTPEQGGDPEFLDFVRGLPCCVYGTPAPSHAHHETGNGRGKGQKAPDRRTMPMSARAHREFHDGKGHFEYWTAEARKLFQETEILRVQGLFGAYQAGARFTEVSDAASA